MPQGVSFLIGSILDTATISCSSAQENYEVVRVQNEHIRQTYQTSDTTSAWIELALGSATTLDTFFIGNHSVSTQGTIKMQGQWHSAGWADPPFTESLGCVTDSFGASLRKGTVSVTAGQTSTQFTSATTLSVDLEDSANLVYNNKMWTIGGGGDSGANLQKVFSSTDGLTWTEEGTDSFPVDIQMHRAEVFNNKIFVMGGSDSDLKDYDTVYSSSDGQSWSLEGTMPGGTRLHSSVVHQGVLHVFGGRASGAFGSTVNLHYYSTNGTTWSSGTGLPENSRQHQTTHFAGKVWFTGGNINSVASDTVLSSTDGGTWVTMSSLPVATWQHSTVTASDRMFLLEGVVESANGKDIWYTNDGTAWKKIGNNANTIGAGGQGVLATNLMHFQEQLWFRGGVPARDQSAALWIRPHYKHWRIYIEDPTTSNTSTVVGRVLGGRKVQPSRNISDGFRLRRKDTSRIQNVIGGQTGNYTARDQHETLEFRYNNVPESHVDQIKGFFNSVGYHKPLLVSLMPEERPHHMSYYCQMTQPVKAEHVLQRHFNLPDLRFEEKV